MHDYGCVAASAMGYIHGNLPGAVLGEKAYHYLTQKQSMARYRESKGKAKKHGPYRTPTSHRTRASLTRRYSVGSRASNAMSVGSLLPRHSASRRGSGGGASTITSVSGISSRVASVKVKGAKKVAFKKNKRIPVSRSFRKKVNEVIADKALPSAGYHQMLYIDSLPLTEQYGQNVKTIPASTNLDGALFTPAQVMNSAARLYLNKAPDYNPVIGSATNFPVGNFVVDVKKQYATYRIKNNGQRTINLSMYVCAPKQNSPDINSPTESWKNAMTTALADGVVVPSAAQPTPDPNYIYIKPTNWPVFNKEWKCEELMFVLEPGQSVMHNVEGPAMQYRFEKYRQETVFVNNQKFTRSVMFVSHTDLVYAAPNVGPGVYERAGTLSNGNDIIVECVTHISMEIPEQVGFTVGSGVISGQQILGSRVRKVAYDYSYVKLVPDIIERVDEENPGLVTAIA